MQRRPATPPPIATPLARVRDRSRVSDRLTPSRLERIERIQQQVRAGTYDEQQHIDAILERVAEDLKHHEP